MVELPILHGRSHRGDIQFLIQKPQRYDAKDEEALSDHGITKEGDAGFWAAAHCY
jgi:hypothetical protein